MEEMGIDHPGFLEQQFEIVHALVVATSGVQGRR
jgi:hypothetical protein